jgi:hypothetical protein
MTNNAEPVPGATDSASPAVPRFSRGPVNTAGLIETGVIEASSDSRSGGKLGPYSVVRVLGEGGMGCVLLARDTRTGVEVAIKVLKPRFANDRAVQRRFRTEARHMHRMTHDNILSVLDVCTEEAYPYYVMPFIKEGSLRERMTPGEGLDRHTVLRVASQVAEALHYAHRKGIIHRDIKPDNILVSGDAHVQLTDFGLLRTVFNDSMIDVRTDPVEGTVPYMSPYVVQGNAEDTRCDIYAFGALMYEMLTGRVPYSAPTIKIMVERILEGPPPRISVVTPAADPELVKVTEGCMARRLRDRYAEMGDVIDDLARAAKGLSVLGPHEIEQEAVRGRRVILGAVAALVLVGVSFGGYHAFLRNRMPPAESGGQQVANDAGRAHHDDDMDEAANVRGGEPGRHDVGESDDSRVSIGRNSASTNGPAVQPARLPARAVEQPDNPAWKLVPGRQPAGAGQRVIVRTERDTYRVGETLTFRISVNRDSYVTLIDFETGGELTVLLPNRYQPDVPARAGSEVVFPAEGTGLEIAVKGPPGIEGVRVYATDSPLKLTNDAETRVSLRERLCSTIEALDPGEWNVAEWIFRIEE